MDKVKVYGADWCEDTAHAREFLDSLNVSYQYINIEKDGEAAQWVRRHNEGKERKPTIKIGDRVLTVPGDGELESALREKGLIS
jgi:glutaredoxin